jgi:hypothetical protein
VVVGVDTSGGELAVTIGNRGDTAVTAAFWVDLYLNPRRAPGGVNEVWSSVGDNGAAWGVTGADLPLAPGATLTLRLGDERYRSDLSRLPEAIAAGSTLYIQVDSANTGNALGAVRESHEPGGPYNNILGPLSVPVELPVRLAPAALRRNHAGDLPPRLTPTARPAGAGPKAATPM